MACNVLPTFSLNRFQPLNPWINIYLLQLYAFTTMLISVSMNINIHVCDFNLKREREKQTNHITIKYSWVQSNRIINVDKYFVKFYDDTLIAVNKERNNIIFSSKIEF